jgi:hypothetical protein
MSFSELANIANLISSVAVLGSLIFLGQQIRQSARNQRSIMDRGRSQQVSDWLQFIASPEMAPLVLRGHALDPKPTLDEHHRYIWCMYPILLHYEDSFYQHRERMLGEEQHISICNQMRDSARVPGFRAVWAEVRDRFPEEFRSFADRMFATSAEE